MLYYQEYNVLQKATEAGEKKILCLKTNGMENFSQKLVRVIYKTEENCICTVTVIVQFGKWTKTEEK